MLYMASKAAFVIRSAKKTSQGSFEVILVKFLEEWVKAVASREHIRFLCYLP